MDSVLNSVKAMLGITAEYEAFDTEIIIHINSVLGILGQVCPFVNTGASISDANDTWNSVVTDLSEVTFVRTYVYLKVRLVFDPPTGAVLDAMKETIRELEWRLSIADADETVD